MEKQVRRRETTAEQMYQEDLLENAYRTSGNLTFEKRADIMMGTFRTEGTGMQQEMQPGKGYSMQA